MVVGVVVVMMLLLLLLLFMLHYKWVSLICPKCTKHLTINIYKSMYICMYVCIYTHINNNCVLMC